MPTSLFQDGTGASAAQVRAALHEIRDAGQAILDDLAHARTDTLLRFEQGLASLNNRRSQAGRILSPDIPCRFLVSDLLAIDQGRSSATIRIDSQSATLRERSQPSLVRVRSQRFTTSTGAIEQFQNMYRVHVDDGTRPTGTFDIELEATVDLTVAVIDIVSLPSDPGIEVSVSPDGVVYTPADSVSLAGYRVNAWFPSTPVRFLRLVVKPTHADSIGGTEFTFGITAFSASIVQYHLASSVYTRPVSFAPRTSQVRFRAKADDRISYYLTFDNGSSFQVLPGQLIDIPGALSETQQLRINNNLVLCTGTDQTDLVPFAVPADLYPPSLSVSLVNPQTLAVTPLNVTFGFSPAAELPAHACFASVGGRFEYAPVVQGVLDQLQASLIWDNATLLWNNATNTWEMPLNPFRISYVRGPATVTAALHVQLTSQDSNLTPVFTGAWLENVY